MPWPLLRLGARKSILHEQEDPQSHHRTCVPARFAAVGVLFYVNWVVQKPFAIILFLTDNLTTSTLTASRIYENGADNRLNLENCPTWDLSRRTLPISPLVIRLPRPPPSPQE